MLWCRGLVCSSSSSGLLGSNSVLHSSNVGAVAAEAIGAAAGAGAAARGALVVGDQRRRSSSVGADYWSC
ncbi:hypothetical protein Syun_008371 [Stephania yunnanensis]|uniref:Uncharacterized protein n=1 Tax=Stephania yunnanensis TaxID=152371 RepID=A0AAP0KF12_9MAGN